MLGPRKTRDLDRPVLIIVESHVPKDHLYRHLHRVLDLSFVRDLVADRYASGGRPSVDPEVFFRLQLMMFFAGIRSERQLLEQADYNLAMRWYAGYNVDEPLPDHSSLSKIRARLGLPVFRRFFEAITEQCIRAGLVWGEKLIFDATKVRANASMDSLIPRLHLLTAEHLATLEPPEPPTTLWEENNARWHASSQVGVHIPLINLTGFSADPRRLIAVLTRKVGESRREKSDNFRHRCERNVSPIL
jgi:transposase